MLDKIKQAIVPICNALVDPDEDWMNSQRFIVGSNRDPNNNLIAFVLDKDQQRNVHFTERFVDQQLDWYKSCLTQPFNFDGHSQAATLIHELAHFFPRPWTSPPPLKPDPDNKCSRGEALKKNCTLIVKCHD
jgi:hypothetical protein